MALMKTMMYNISSHKFLNVSVRKSKSLNIVLPGIIAMTRKGLKSLLSMISELNVLVLVKISAGDSSIHLRRRESKEGILLSNGKEYVRGFVYQFSSK